MAVIVATKRMTKVMVVPMIDGDVPHHVGVDMKSGSDNSR